VVILIYMLHATQNKQTKNGGAGSVYFGHIVDPHNYREPSECKAPKFNVKFPPSCMPKSSTSPGKEAQWQIISSLEVQHGLIITTAGTMQLID